MKKTKEVDFKTLYFIYKLAKKLKPKEDMSISQWADKNMILPKGSNEAGSFHALPYQKAIMDAITDPYVTDISVMSSAQIGKTTIILSGIGYYIDYEPTTQLVVMPTLSLGEKFSKTRLAAMIRDVRSLSGLIAPPKSKDSNNTILFKEYPGGHLVVAGANSPASLSSFPLRVIWMDETDRYPESAGSEGNPIRLAETRSLSFWNAKHIKTSTPGTAGKSKIEKAYLSGSMEEWCVECPCCGKWQPYDFHRVVFDSVSMVCVECGEEIPESDWKESRHKWIAQHPERKSHKSFHLNQLASPYVEWKDIIQDFKAAMEQLKKYHDPEDLKVFVNTVLGEPWEEAGLDEKKMDKDVLQQRAEYYNADIPDGVLLLTASVDVQDDRFEVEVRGWSRNYESWGIYKTEIYGETRSFIDLEKNEIWDRLEKYLGITFSFYDGRELNIAAIGIDTGGHHTNRTYKWVKHMKNKGKRVYGLKGYANKPDIPLLYKRTKVDIREVDNRGKEVVVDSTTIHIIGVDSGKGDIMNRLSIEEKGEGYCHFPSNDGRGYDEDYYKGLLSEHQIEKKVNGVIRKKWVKKAGVKRNEPLDLFNYNYAVSELLNPVWDELEAKLEQGINYMKATRKRSAKRRNPQKGLVM